jgi:hypothetical protein
MGMIQEEILLMNNLIDGEAIRQLILMKEILFQDLSEYLRQE